MSNKTAVKKCKHCQGNGQLLIFKVCIYCDNGILIHYDLFGLPYKVRCNECHGAGKKEIIEKCHVCKGAGHI